MRWRVGGINDAITVLSVCFWQTYSRKTECTACRVDVLTVVIGGGGGGGGGGSGLW